MHGGLCLCVRESHDFVRDNIISFGRQHFAGRIWAADLSRSAGGGIADGVERDGVRQSRVKRQYRAFR